MVREMTDHVALVRLSWPAKPLWQNSRPHWAQKARATSAQRLEAKVLAKMQHIERIGDGQPVLRFEFHPPDNRRRDVQNAPEAVKAAIDGIADALGRDDHKFRCQFPEEWSEPVKGGCVLIEISTVGKAATSPTNHSNGKETLP